VDACGVRGPGTLTLQTNPLIKETDMLPVEVLESIAAWRCLTEAEQVSRLRECVVDEVVGNMRMEGQPVSAEWESAARRSMLRGGPRLTRGGSSTTAT
jgi:hypothetical protein